MTIDELLSHIEDKALPLSAKDLASFEHAIGESLPDDYRDFLLRCNGGYFGHWPIQHIGGFRPERTFSLSAHMTYYRSLLPGDVIWIMDDTFGNAICLGPFGEGRGKIFFWEHESTRITEIAESFLDFVAKVSVPST